MSMLAIIGGSGLYNLSEFGDPTVQEIVTEYSAEPVAIEIYDTATDKLAFLPRHGKQHGTPPHKVNYRANIAALKTVGATELIAINAVGGITSGTGPGSLVVPDQVIDYTWGRAATFYEDAMQQVVHIDFTSPFTESLRARLLAVLHADTEQGEDARLVIKKGVYGCTQGPRLETAAEIKRLQQDGCDIVGMTAMPEAALAREAELDYAMLALSVNWAAGIVPGEITMAEIEAVMASGMVYIRKMLVSLVNSKH